MSKELRKWLDANDIDIWSISNGLHVALQWKHGAMSCVGRSMDYQALDGLEQIRKREE